MVPDYQIAIPSYRRPETLCKKTLAFLRRHAQTWERITVFVADAEEGLHYQEAILSAYGACPNIVVGQLGIGKQRNFIQQFYPEGTRVLSLDDDVQDVVQRQTRYKQPDATIVPLANLDHLVDIAFSMIEASKLRLWGIHPVDNPFFLKNLVSFDLRYIVACFYGFIANRDPLTLVKLEDKEDFERSIRYYMLDGGVLRFNYLAPRTNYYTEPGGMQATRTKLRVRQSAYWLVRHFPDFCEINKGKRSGWCEVKLRDKRKKGDAGHTRQATADTPSAAGR